MGHRLVRFNRKFAPMGFYPLQARHHQALRAETVAAAVSRGLPHAAVDLGWDGAAGHRVSSAAAAGRAPPPL
jgi:hypothetical protein